MLVLFFSISVTLTVFPIQDPGRYIRPELSELLPTRLRTTIVLLDVDFLRLRLFICLHSLIFIILTVYYILSYFLAMTIN